MNSKTQKKGARKESASRNTQLQRIKAGFSKPSTPAYAAAWDEFKQLVLGLYADAEFLHINDALPLLPHLIAARAAINERKQAASK